MLLINSLPSVRSDLLSWKGSVGSAEISDFGPGFEFKRVFDDACDVGMIVVGTQPGFVGYKVAFALTETHKDAEGDIQYWELTSVSPRHGEYTLKIWND